MTENVCMSEVAGSAYLSERKGDESWERWYERERMEVHAAIMRDAKVECRYGEVKASIPLDKPKDLHKWARWLKANRPKRKRGRPAKVQVNAERWPDLVAFEQEQKMGRIVAYVDGSLAA
jgi:hypothetical protein